MIEWKQTDGQTDRQTDRDGCITCHINAIGNNFCTPGLCCRRPSQTRRTRRLWARLGHRWRTSHEWGPSCRATTATCRASSISYETSSRSDRPTSTPAWKYIHLYSTVPKQNVWKKENSIKTDKKPNTENRDTKEQDNKSISQSVKQHSTRTASIMLCFVLEKNSLRIWVIILETELPMLGFNSFLIHKGSSRRWCPFLWPSARLQLMLRDHG